ncbi:MAG: hypothetical protein U0Z44_09820 [Kouleothrix sp.]
MFFRRPLTAQWWNDRGYALTGARAALPLPDLLAGGLAVPGYPGLAPLDRVRLNVLLAYLKLGVRDWRPLERVTAAAWTRRWGGDSLYRGFFQPLLEGKFGPYAEQVNMAWLWSRFKARSVQLGYFVGASRAWPTRWPPMFRRRAAACSCVRRWPGWPRCLAAAGALHPRTAAPTTPTR